MGWRADVAGGVVEDEVFEMDDFAVDPQRGAGIGEVSSFDPPASDRRARNALVETGERDGCEF